MSRKILVVSIDHVGSSMAGPGVRAFRFAAELAKEHEVTLAVPYETDLDPAGFGVVQVRPDDDRALTRLALQCDAVVAQRLPVRTMERLARSPVRTVFDLYAPIVVERFALDAEREQTAQRDAWFRCLALEQEVVLRTGDAFVCANERQRDFWLGSLVALGRIDQQMYDADPSLRNLVDVVPFGVEPEYPAVSDPVLKGVVPGIAPDDKLLLWASGIWDWFDPLTIIRAVGVLAQRRSDVKLYFLAGKHPNPAIGEMKKVARAHALAEELGLRDRHVFFNAGWVPYAERGRYLAEADIGVCAHLDNLETRLALRMRLMDCFWAALPVVTTEGDALSELVATRDLGRVVGYEDLDGWVAALGELLDDDGARERMRRNLQVLREELAWPEVVRPLSRLVAQPGRAMPRSAGLELAVANYLAARVKLSVILHGPLGMAARVARVAAGGARRRLG